MKINFRKFVGLMKALATIISYFFLVIPSRIILFRKRIWIVSEEGYEARDNGFSFYKYMRTKHKEVNCYYAIKKNSADYHRVEPFGNILQFGSFKHFFYFCGAKYIISSKTLGFCPNYYLELVRQKIHLFGTFVFLQHGITKDDQKFLYAKKSKIDLFICGAKPEFDDIKLKYGYRPNQIVYTGFSRFDSYFGSDLRPIILIMPTWRRYIEKQDFQSSDFYKFWSTLLNSNRFNELLTLFRMKAVFYLHPQIRDFFTYFDTKNANVIVSSFDQTDLQALIRESKMLITDFSSLAFDFGYMSKPLIYYQFDEQRYFSSHYIKGYFDYRRDGFGRVCTSLGEVLNELERIFESNFSLSNAYKKNKEKFFPIYDSNNCQRIYNAILNFKKR